MKVNNKEVLNYDLDYLLAPVSKSDFYEKYYGKDFLYVKGDPDKFSSLLTFEDINELLQKFRLDVPNIRLVKDGAVLSRNSIIEEGIDYHYVTEKMPFLNVNAVASYLQQGYVMAIDDIHQFVTNLYLLRIALEWEMRDRNKMNCYIGKESSRGFGVHWDNHDVIIMQIQGSKVWNLYGLTEQNPLRPYSSQKNPPSEIIKQITMNPGDFLYFPRGFWHATQADKGFSVHITLGITRKNNVDYFDWLKNFLIKDSFFRESFPAKNNHEMQSLREKFIEKITTQINTFPPEFYNDDVEQSIGAPMLSFLPYSIDENSFSDDLLIRFNTFRPVTFSLDQQKPEVMFNCNKKHWRLSVIFLETLEILNAGKFLSLNEIYDKLETKVEKNTIRQLFIGFLQKGLLMACEVK